MFTLLTEITRWLGANYPLMLALLIVTAFVGGFIRGFDLGTFHWPGFTDLWKLNGDRKRHEYKLNKSHITFSDRGLAREDRKWRRRVRDVIRDSNWHKIKIEFVGNESISPSYIDMWLKIVRDFSHSCYFDFDLIGGDVGQSRMLDALLKLQFELVRDEYNKTGNVNLDVPLAVHSAVHREPAPNKLINEFVRDKAVIK